MEVVPHQLSRLADVCLDASQDVADGWSEAVAGLAVDGFAAGNTPGGASVLSAHQVAVDAAGGALGAVSGVLEKDMDALLQCAFDFASTDEAAARDLQTTGGLIPGLPVRTGG
jgi:hypothetical protein